MVMVLATTGGGGGGGRKRANWAARSLVFFRFFIYREVLFFKVTWNR
jgi:hypothetical protein